MLPELRHLRYLRAVADHGNFTPAAQDLHMSQPTLSQQIQQLERAIGAQLLDFTDLQSILVGGVLYRFMVTPPTRATFSEQTS